MLTMYTTNDILREKKQTNQRHQMTNTKFEAGQTYYNDYFCDTRVLVNILKRTAKFLTITIGDRKEVTRVGVYNYEGEEQCKFMGSYSMAPSIVASNKLEGVK